MKTTITVFLLALALLLAGCGAPATNTNTTANANTNRNTPAAPTVDALFDLEKKANEAYTKGDSAFFEGFLSDRFTMMGPKGEHMTKADTVKMIGSVKCDIKSMDLTDPQMAKIDADTYVISTKFTAEGSCTSNGHTDKMDKSKPIRAASVYVRNGDKWMGAWHGETPVMEPKGDAKKDDKAETKKDDTKKDEAKKEEPKKDDAKKSDAKAPESATADSKATAAKAPAATDKTAESKPAAADANTDALMKIHTAGWEAYKARDAKKLGELTTADLSTVAPDGMWFGAKDAVIKSWTEPKCDIKSTSLADGFATALSPTVEVLYAKGTAVGTCDGPDGKPMKLGSLWNAAVYVKDGSDWKLAFLFESPAM